MPHKKKPRRYITPLVLFTLAGWALWALGRNEPTAETPDAGTTDRRPTTGSTTAPSRTRATWSKRRLATSLAFATLFFGGAAFSAGAGDVVSNAIEDDDSADVTSTEEAPADDATAEESNDNGENGEAEPPADDPAGDEANDNGEDNGRRRPARRRGRSSRRRWWRPRRRRLRPRRRWRTAR